MNAPSIDGKPAGPSGQRRISGPEPYLRQRLYVAFASECRAGIVAKRRDRPYRSGRCADWIKIKNPEVPARVIEW